MLHVAPALGGNGRVDVRVHARGSSGVRAPTMAAVVCAAEQPQLPPAAFVPQHAALSVGSQHAACVSAAQHEDVEVVSSAMRSAP
jgi:hypothetical protein